MFLGMSILIAITLIPFVSASSIDLFRNDSLSHSVALVTFDGAEGTTFKFRELNDPVMV